MVDVSSLVDTTLSFAIKGITYFGKYSAVRFSKKKQLDLTSECLTETRGIFEKFDDPAVRQALDQDEDEAFRHLVFQHEKLRTKVRFLTNHETSLSDIRVLRSRAEGHNRETRAFSESILDKVVVIKIKKEMVLNKRSVGSDGISEAEEPDSILIPGNDSTQGGRLVSKETKLKAKINSTEKRQTHAHKAHKESHSVINQITVNNTFSTSTTPFPLCPFCEITPSFNSKGDLLMHLSQVHDIR